MIFFLLSFQGLLTSFIAQYQIELVIWCESYGLALRQESTWPYYTVLCRRKTYVWDFRTNKTLLGLYRHRIHIFCDMKMIHMVEGHYYLYSENKDTDQVCCYHVD